MIAKLEAIPLESVYNMPTLQALNNMAYIKAKFEHEKIMNRKQ
jgi:hypothetical protein